jgi:hypothetical protein
LEASTSRQRQPWNASATVQPSNVEVSMPSATLKSEIQALLDRSKQLRDQAAENMRQSAAALAKADELLRQAEGQAHDREQRRLRVRGDRSD